MRLEVRRVRDAVGMELWPVVAWMDAVLLGLILTALGRRPERDRVVLLVESSRPGFSEASRETDRRDCLVGRGMVVQGGRNKGSRAERGIYHP